MQCVDQDKGSNIFSSNGMPFPSQHVINFCLKLMKIVCYEVIQPCISFAI